MSRLHLVAVLLITTLLAGCPSVPGTGNPENPGSPVSSVPPSAKAAQTISAVTPIKGVEVKVDYQDGVFYRVKVHNTRPSEIKLRWDESTYVSTDGRAVRILRVDNRSNLPEYATARQPSTPIASGAEFASEFTGEEWLSCARRNCSPTPKDRLAHAQIYLTFEIKGKQVRWQGDVVFTPPNQAGRR